MAIYALYPTRADGISTTLAVDEFDNDTEALLAAVALLEQHDSAASVVIWEGKRRVLQCIRAERDEGPPSAVRQAARSRARA